MAVQLHDDRGLISKPIRAFSAIFLSTLVVPLLIWGRGPGQEPTKRDAQAPSMTTGGDYVGSDTCITCHADQGKHFQSTIMGKAFAHPRTDLEKLGCEACHGPGRAHVEAGGTKETVAVRFARIPQTPSKKRTMPASPATPGEAGYSGMGARTNRETSLVWVAMSGTNPRRGNFRRTPASTRR